MLEEYCRIKRAVTSLDVQIFSMKGYEILLYFKKEVSVLLKNIPSYKDGNMTYPIRTEKETWK